MSTYYTLVTAVGQGKIANAVALGTMINLTQMAVGDGNGNPTTPSEAQTTLVRERYRTSISRLDVDSTNPNYIVAEMVIPTTVGGWSIYEVGVFDDAGALIAVANFPATYKPVLDEGSGRDLVVRIIIQVSATSVVTLKVDPAVILASQKWVVDNFSNPRYLPGGTTNQILTKNSNADGDVKWASPLAVGIAINALQEIQTTAAGQDTFTLSVVSTVGVAIYVEGVREQVFTTISPTQVRLSRTLPAGLKVLFVQNDPNSQIVLPTNKAKRYFFMG